MKIKMLLALGAVLALLAAPAGAKTAKGTTVTIRIEGLKKTLLLPTVVRTNGGSIVKNHHQCPADTAQGALDIATHGRWTGTWYPSYNEWLVSSILGEKPKGDDYWELFVNNKAASVGACDVKAHTNQQFLFADESGVLNPSALKSPPSAIRGKSFKAKVLGYTASGKPVALSRVVVTGNGITNSKTNSQGVVTVTDVHAGVLVLRTAPKGYMRTEAIVHVNA